MHECENEKKGKKNLRKTGDRKKSKTEEERQKIK